jgi:hypothetical protein
VSLLEQVHGFLVARRVHPEVGSVRGIQLKRFEYFFQFLLHQLYEKLIGGTSLLGTCSIPGSEHVLPRGGALVCIQHGQQDVLRRFVGCIVHQNRFDKALLAAFVEHGFLVNQLEIIIMQHACYLVCFCFFLILFDLIF